MKVVLLLFLLPLALALPLELISGDDDSIQIELQQYSVHKDVFKAKQAIRMAKWGPNVKRLPKYHQKLLEPAYKNDYITTTVSIGTPAQDFTVMYSSGSARSWVLDASYSQRGGNQNVYSNLNSSTSKDLKSAFSNVDGSFNASGNYYSDLFKLGKIKVNSQAFGAVSQIEEDQDLELFPIDGVIGLNHYISSTYKSGKEPAALIDNILKPVTNKVVTYFLAKHVAPSKGSTNGSVTLGGYNKEKCDASKMFLLDNLDTNDDNRYIAYLAYIKFGDTYLSQDTSCLYFDTDISTIMLPYKMLQKLFSMIEVEYDWDSGLNTLDCGVIKSYNSLFFQFRKSNPISVKPEDYILDLDLDDNKCAVALEPVSGDYFNQEDVILGTPFFRDQCVIYDFGSNSVYITNHVK